MKCVIQRVSSATVHLPQLNESRSIGQGLLVYVWISKSFPSQAPETIEKFARKIAHLNIFSDETGKICRSLHDEWGELLLISNFTLYGRNKKWTQIDFGHAAPYQEAEKIYHQLVTALKTQDISVTTGEFGGYMRIESVVEWPVNLVWEG